jgi:hypothetical protein
MQFDSACGKSCTSLDMIQNQYKSAGYTIPTLVFWNLRSDTTSDFVAVKNEKNVCLVSGFSPSILKSIIEAKVVTPYDLMREVLDNERYSSISLPNNK